MTRIYATAKKMIEIDVTGQSVIVRAGRKVTTRTFRNRYTLRLFVTNQIAAAEKAGFVSVNR